MKKKKYNLDELLKNVTDENLHGEIFTEGNVGKELPQDNLENQKPKLQVPSKEDYEKACEKMEEIIHFVNNDTPTSDPYFQELDKVSDIIIAYEEEYFPIGDPTLEYKGFEGTVEWNDHDECYYGQVVGIEPDLVSYEGKTIEELEEDFRVAMNDYLDGKIIVLFEKVENNYAASIQGLDDFVCTADTFEKLKQEVKEGLAFHLKGLREGGNFVPERFNSEVDFVWRNLNVKLNQDE